MLKLEEIVKTFNQFQVSAIMIEYQTEHNPQILKPLAENLNKLMKQYIKELEEEQKEANTNDNK